MPRGLLRLLSSAVVITVIGGLFVAIASADTSVSPNYQFSEPAVGFDGLIQSSSSSYQTIESVGGGTVGNSNSTNFQIQAGSRTTNDPTLSFAVNTASSSFGVFSPTGTATTTSSFTVADYTSFGYAVQIVGTPPTNGSHTITAMAATGSSTVGIEQFGLNLVANTTPAAFGINPDNGQFGFGTAGTNYATANNYRYVSGETIATAPKSSGLTNYTISYIINVSSLTPGGNYSSNQSIICTGTY